MKIHRFSTPEGIEITVTIKEKEIVDDCRCLNFTVNAEVPGYTVVVCNLPPWKQTLDIRAWEKGEK